MLITAVLISLAALLVILCAAIGVISIIVVIDDHRGSRAKNLTDRSPTRAGATARQILGVGARREEGDL